MHAVVRDNSSCVLFSLGSAILSGALTNGVQSSSAKRKVPGVLKTKVGGKKQR